MASLTIIQIPGEIVLSQPPRYYGGPENKIKVTPQELPDLITRLQDLQRKQQEDKMPKDPNPTANFTRLIIGSKIVTSGGKLDWYILDTTKSASMAEGVAWKAVNSKLYKEVKIINAANWPDYRFDSPAAVWHK